MRVIMHLLQTGAWEASLSFSKEISIDLGKTGFVDCEDFGKIPILYLHDTIFLKFMLLTSPKPVFFWLACKSIYVTHLLGLSQGF